MKIILILITPFFIFSCREKNKIENLVVIGGGLMGSSVAWEYGMNNNKVLLIEKQDTTYSIGSSYGEARITRSLGPKEDIFGYIQQKTVSESINLIAYLNELDSIEHSMEEIYTTTPLTHMFYHSKKKMIDKLPQNSIDKFEYSDTPKISYNVWGLTVPDSAIIIREHNLFSGTLNPKVLISKLHRAIKMNGGEISYNEKVIKLNRDNGIFQIQTKNVKTGLIKNILAEKIVVAAGAYSGQLLKDLAPYVEQLITPKRVALSFFKIKNSVFKSLTKEQQKRFIEHLPFSEIGSNITYSMVETFEDNNPIVKIGHHFSRTDVENLDDVWRQEVTAQEIKTSKNWLLKYAHICSLPITLSDIDFQRGYSCVYSVTNNETPYVSYLTDDNNTIDSNLVLIGGMSGTGAKGSLTYGLLATDLLLKKNDTTLMYQKTKRALGSKRMIEDRQRLDN